MKPRTSDSPELTTEDNRTPIKNGSRVYNYYDGKWGVVRFDDTTKRDGWFIVEHDDGTSTALNGVRVSSKEI